MSYDKKVSDHYTYGQLLEAIQEAVTSLSKTIDKVTIEDLAPVDELHIGGRLATEHLLSQLDFSENDHILDVGCGLGGAARFMATRCHNRVTGIDLTPELVETGRVLCAWVGLTDQVTLQQGDALAMPFDDNTFAGATMFHVGMNIADKPKLFAEIYRVLTPKARLGVYDVMQINEGTLTYPVPWATEPSTSKLASPAQYKQALSQTGFQIVKETSRRTFALDFFNQVRAQTKANGGPSPLSLHILTQESTSLKIKNMIDGLLRGLIDPVEIIVQK
jgi:ubiquinone/menaquinone biosynthesis C-methylase UbiE